MGNLIIVPGRNGRLALSPFYQGNCPRCGARDLEEDDFDGVCSFCFAYPESLRPVLEEIEREGHHYYFADAGEQEVCGVAMVPIGGLTQELLYGSNDDSPHERR